ncbi:hypothetical protein VHEMI10451 [[Torrubiella] hemipterigena]|uniref:UDENN FLCN/SMCR8-type domain-containing protein n=1 Tax=[Torrubiella] hemipterigena TaxID=1531966 RepID=A0A0A1TTA9_9HYPO|nr:hypothetical protein VHEMI10451 [[Torrubiella] hemipterigena]
MTYILCLAHYCDTHGPTPLMVTEGLPTPCSVCFDESSRDDPPRSSPPNQDAQLADAIRSVNLNRNSSGITSPRDSQSKRTSIYSSNADSVTSNASSSTTAPETPPESPRPAFQQPRRTDSGYRRTYDETVTRKQGPCDNCAMTLPRRQAGVGGSDDMASLRGPTLRTRAPAERVYGSPAQLASPARSQASSDTDGEKDVSRRPRNRIPAQSVSSRTTSCSSTSTTSERASCHVHYVDYTSTHEPLLATSFSLIRASCLRALSFETLPRAPSTSTPNASPQSNGSAFVTTQSAGSAATGGPIFFGDALAGYTTAYIFRIPDVHARGHKRVYAFLALSTHKERLAMKTFAVLSNAFRDLANWIQQLAEAEAERTAESQPGYSVGLDRPVLQASAFDPPAADRSGSSFLTGGLGLSRRMGPGAPSSLKARGLAELVGQPDFFIELHKRFVHLLFEVGVTLSS